MFSLFTRGGIQHRILIFTSAATTAGASALKFARMGVHGAEIGDVQAGIWNCQNGYYFKANIHRD